MSGVIGREANLRVPGLLKDHLSVRNGHAILVHNREAHRPVDRRCLPSGRNDAAEEKQPRKEFVRTPKTLHGSTAASLSMLDARLPAKNPPADLREVRPRSFKPW
jgi:hypothetical protein